MSGLLRMEAARFSSGDGYAIQSSLSDWDLRLEQLFREQEIVSNLKLSMESFKLRHTELELAEHQLSNIQSVPTNSFHMEAHKDKQENLILRCENILSDIWAAISKFFGWIADAITGMFGDDEKDSDVSPTVLNNSVTEALNNVDASIRTSDYTLGGMASILNMSSEQTATATIEHILDSLKASPVIGDYLTSRIKDIANSKKAEKAEIESKNFFEAIKGLNEPLIANMVKNKPTGENIFLLQDKKSAVFFGISEKGPAYGTKSLEINDEKVELSGDKAGAILKYATKIGPEAVKIRKYLNSTVRPQSKELKSLVEKLSNAKTDEEFKNYSAVIKGLASCMRVYVAFTFKITKQSRTILKAVKNSEESLKPFMKSKNSEKKEDKK